MIYFPSARWLCAREIFLWDVKMQNQKKEKVRVVNLMVGGPEELIPWDLVVAHRQEPWVAVDKGAVRLVKMGMVPDYALGDFDSSTKEEEKAVVKAVGRVRTFPPEPKDYTDTQLGIKAVLDHFDFEQVNLWGATGGRIDHFLNNLFLPLIAPFDQVLTRLCIIDRGNVVRYYQPGNYAIKKLPSMKYLAFVNLTAVKDMTLIDEKYTRLVQHWDSQVPVSWASNEFVGDVNHFSLGSGIVAVIQSRDVSADHSGQPE